jgi:cytochrome c oxidase subunit 2
MIHFAIVAVLVAISTFVLGSYFSSGVLLPPQASSQAVFIDELFAVHGWLVAFFLSLIVVFILYSVVVFRRRKGELGDGYYTTGNKKLEVVWTIIPTIIVLWLAVVGAQVLADVERRDRSAIEVNVFASQWNWSFEYENGAFSSDLVLPKDQQILLRLHSEDVIHSFWVPEFRVKQDILPGGEEYVRELRITPNELGDFKIRCAEICGTLHYAMLADVRVVSSSEFDTWLSDQLSAGCELEAVECGRILVGELGCVACHSLDGSVIIGPSWQGIAGTEELLIDGSSVFVDADYLTKAILDPNIQVVEGFTPGLMPAIYADMLSADEISDIVAFILSLE